MKIKTYQHGSRWYADIETLPGTPPVGDGLTENMAIATLLMRLAHEPVFLEIIRRETVLEVNSVPYE